MGLGRLCCALALMAALLAPAYADDTGRPFLAYHAGWYEVHTDRPEDTSLARLPGYITHVALSFAKPDMVYPGNLELKDTGLQYPYSGAVLKQAIALLKQRNPHTKVLIYLNDVGLDEGPFRYIDGSHRGVGDFELAVRKTNDKLRIKPPLFMALPEEFQLLADFGDHIDPDSDEAKAFLAREIAAYDDQKSDLVLFDYHGVHRGGFVRKGARRILQVNFAPKA